MMKTSFIAKVAQKYNLSEQKFREALCKKNTDNKDNLLSVTCAMYLENIKYPIKIT